MNYYKLIKGVSSPAPRYLLRLAALVDLGLLDVGSTRFQLAEIGPGSGDVCEYYLAQDECAKVFAVEFSEQAAKGLVQRFSDHSKFTLYQDDVFSIPDEYVFDVVLAFEVFEHIEADRKAFLKVFDMLAGGGRLILSVPAYMKKWQAQDVYSGHVRRYEKSEIIEKLQGAGFVDVQVYDYGFPLTAIMYPFREFFYRKDESVSNEVKSKRSGVDRPLISRVFFIFMVPIVCAFAFVQRFFYRSEYGDGFIVCAKK
ncbi:methyltransferase domain-containing protein [Simiduia aestuariiviva]|uniref:SAM-dependent methyltransferase n=1 Tax=Simiduia aestuariiviva TaxID=1510459 RepID=A0A839ULM5_9GAMM|nr:SAM-dependent methyltransferase [Simiduia aestuariiviva]